MAKAAPNVLPFNEWTPDSPDFGNPGGITAQNVIPTPYGYKPMGSPAVFSNALNARCQGAQTFIDQSSTVSGFAGTATKLYKSVGGTYSDVTRASGGAYNCGASSMWKFAQNGALVVALQNGDAPQGFTLGSSTLFTLLSSDGNLPTGKYIGVCRNQIGIGNIASHNQRFQWSALNGGSGASDWTSSQATLADFQDLSGDHGQIQGVLGGEYWTIFMERAIYRGDFVGVPLIYNFTKVEQGRGCLIPGSIAASGRLSFFCSDDGFYRFDGFQSVPIGFGKVNKFFFKDLDQSNTDRCSAAMDPKNALYMLAYPGAGNIGGNPNRILIYHWIANRWAIVILDGSNGTPTQIELICPDLSKGYTLEQLDTISSSLDALPASLDSAIWAGGKLSLACFDSSHKLNYFTGSNLGTILETTEVQPTRGGRSMVNGFRPVIEGTAVTFTASVGQRETQTASRSYGSDTSPETNGLVPALASGRYFTFRTKIASGSDWDHAVGVSDVDALPDGMQ